MSRYHHSPTYSFPSLSVHSHRRHGALLCLYATLRLSRGREKEARCSKPTSSSGVVSDSRGISARKKVGDLVGARVVAKKNCRLRYATRWHEIAMLHRLLETGCNRRPVRGTFDLIVRALRGGPRFRSPIRAFVRSSRLKHIRHSAGMNGSDFSSLLFYRVATQKQQRSLTTAVLRWRISAVCLVFCVVCVIETACENPSPGCLSRRQFVSALSSTLDPCDTSTLHRIYSSFDPDGTDKIRSVDFLACVLVTHKPETEAFLEGLQQTFIGNMG